MTARAQEYGDLGLSKLPWFFNGLDSPNARHLVAKFVASQQISHLVTFLRLGFYVKLCPARRGLLRNWKVLQFLLLS